MGRRIRLRLLRVGLHRACQRAGGAQTVYYPHAETDAFAISDVDPSSPKNVPANRHVLIADLITYTDLLPGRQYTVKSKLVFKDSGTDVRDAQNRKVEATTTFTPTTPNGTLEVRFPEIDAFHFEGTDTVVYEYIYAGDHEVCSHAELSSTSQTLKFITPTDQVALPTAGSQTLLLLQIAGAMVVGAAVLWSTYIAYRRIKRSRVKED